MKRNYNLLPSHEEMLEIATDFNDMGISVIPMANPVNTGRKNPSIYWRNGAEKAKEGKLRNDIPSLLKDYATQECSFNDITALSKIEGFYGGLNYTYGMAGIMGQNDIIVLDWDKVKDWSIREEVLKSLGLDEDYPWNVDTGSGEGFQIWLRCHITDDDFSFYELPASTGVFVAPAKDGKRFHHAELRHKNHYSTLPPSLHPSGGLYKFKGEWPEEAPAEVELVDVLNAIGYLCEDFDGVKPSSNSSYESKTPIVPCHRFMTHPYVKKMIQGMCEQLSHQSKGGRGNLLFAQLYKILPYSNSGHINRDVVIERLTAACAKNGFLDDDPENFRHQLDSAIKKTLDMRNDPPKKDDDVEDEDLTDHANDTLDEVIEKVDEALAKSDRKLPPKKFFAEKSNASADLCKYSADDAGNGDAMYALFGKDFLYCPSLGWLQYESTHWALDENGARVRVKAVEALRLRRHQAVDKEKEEIIKCSKADEKRISACVNRLRDLTTVGIASFDTSPDHLNCLNGVLDLRNGTLEPHNRDQRFTYCLPVDYVEKNHQPWLNYLSNDVDNGNQETIDYLQMAAGYSLTGHTVEENLFYLFGPTRSGKGTFAEAFMKLMPPPLSSGVDFASFTAKREADTSNFDLAPLKPARMVFASESNKGQALNPAKIKQLTGGDPIKCCFKHKTHFEYKPQFKIWMLSNHPVNGDPDDDAIWGRVKVIKFPTSHLGKEDKTIKRGFSKKEALEGILYWSVQGAIKWYALGSAGLATPQSIQQETQKHRDELDYVQQWLDDESTRSADTWISNEDINKSWSTWCKNNNVQFVKGPRALAMSLQVKGYKTGVQKKIAGKNGKGVIGLRLSQPPLNSPGNGVFSITSHKIEPENEKVTDRPEKVTDSPVSEAASEAKVTEEAKGNGESEVTPHAYEKTVFCPISPLPSVTVTNPLPEDAEISKYVRPGGVRRTPSRIVFEDLDPSEAELGASSTGHKSS